MTINLTDPVNHPANGLLAVERIIRVREELQRTLWHKKGSTIDYVTADAIKALDELLERRKDAPEPVADVVAWASPNEGRTCDIRWRRFDVTPGPLYTAPPGPQSSKMSGIMPDYEGVAMTQRECYMAGKEAGLAEARKSPVITDGWIPLSERMPERDVDVQLYCADKKEQMVGYMERNESDGWFRFASWRNGDGVYCQPTHWQPLPAPPQEVKRCHQLRS